MIYLFTGTPGSGKSIHVTKLIKEHIEVDGLPCITNYEYNAGALNSKRGGCNLFVPNRYLSPELLIAFSDQYKKSRNIKRLKEDQILLVIDECQLIFNCRDWNAKGRNEWISFFTQHRKFGYKIILVCQFLGMVDKQLRSLIEFQYMHRKVKNVGVGGNLLNLFSGGNLHVAVKIYMPLNQRLGSEWFKASKNLYALYDSYTVFDGAV